MKNYGLGWICLLVLLIGVNAGCLPVRSLGKNPSGSDLKRIEALPNYQNGEFQNLEKSTTIPPSYINKSPRWFRLFRYLLSKPGNTRPDGPLPVYLTNLKKKETETSVVWFGHSSVLVKSAKGNLLFDPIFNDHAGPLAGLVPAFAGTMKFNSNDLPPIDALIISHDHYDHLDYTTVKKLKKKVSRVIVPIGVGSHFRKWGFPKELITELNWNESTTLLNGIKITATPAHHRSNRGFEQKKTLWASYIVSIDKEKIFFSGDTGYSKHFKLIGDQHGPFDLALMECGQYNANWSQSHMHPTQTVRASMDIKAKKILPIHWAKFAESTHAWNEPVRILMASSDSFQLPVTVPFIGQPILISDSVQRVPWWEFKNE